MKKPITSKMLVILTLAMFFYSCSKDEIVPGKPKDYLSLLPKDLGGEQIAHPWDTLVAPYGYYIYKPSSYNDSNGLDYPLLIFLHGRGELGNSQKDSTQLKKVLRNGPPKLIEKKKWNPPYPMIVVSPQCSKSSWNPKELKAFVEFLLKKYKVNEKRIYMTGLSMGGYGTFNYIGYNGDNSLIAAAVPICGAGPLKKGENFKNIPVWAFHGDADRTVNVKGSIDMVKAINAFEPIPEAKVTIYPGVGHNSWSKTYDGTGMGTESVEYSPFDQSIYDWMFEYERGE